MSKIVSSIVVLFAVLAGPLAAQPLEDCARYSPKALETWMQSPDQRVAAYGHTCRMINVDAYVDEQTQNGFSAVDSHYWLDTYRNTVSSIDRAVEVNRAWAGGDAARNMGILNRLSLKYRKLAGNTEPGVATGSYAGIEVESPAERFGRQMSCQSQIGTSCMAQCGFDQVCVSQCQGGNAWRCNR